MVHDLIKENGRYLRFCGIAAKLCGAYCFFAAVSMIVFPIAQIFWQHLPPKYIAIIFKSGIVISMIGVIFSGFLFWGIDQFLKCLVGADFTPKWILRNSRLLIWLYAGFLLISCGHSLVAMRNIGGSPNPAYAAMAAQMGIIATIKILLWLLFAFVLKIILAIIRESKTPA